MPSASVRKPSNHEYTCTSTTKQEPASRSFIQTLREIVYFLLHALTRIYGMGHIRQMETAFEIIAEPNRRAILSLLASSQQSVGEIERRLHMSQPTVSKHLRVLREAGFVESTVDAQRRLYRLNPEPLQEVDAWLAQFRQFWSHHVDALERHLDRMAQSNTNKKSTPTKSIKKKTK